MLSILYALIAFSVIMVVMTTLVVVAVQVLNGMRGVRERHMRYLLGSMFDEYLWPEYGEYLDPPEVEMARPGKHIRSEQRDIDKGITDQIPDPNGNLACWAKYLDIWKNLEIELAARQYDNADDRRDLRAMNNRKGPVWTIFGVVAWVVIVFFGIALLPSFLLLVLLVFIVLQIDRSREPDREFYSVVHKMDPQKYRALKQINSEATKRAKTVREGGIDLDDPATSVKFNGGLPEIAGYEPNDPKIAEARAEYPAIFYRRMFVDEALKVARGMTTSEQKEKGDGQTSLNVVELAEYVARTQFADAIDQVSVSRKTSSENEDVKKVLKVLLTDLGRRYDDLGRQSTANFRKMTRRASVVLAFAVALAANVDAIHLFGALSKDTELAQLINATYADSLEDMSKLEGEFVARYTALEAQKEEEGTNEAVVADEIEAARHDLEELRDQMDQTVGKLVDIGVPIGAEAFPYCVDQSILTLPFVDGEVSYGHIDSRCIAMIKALGNSVVSPPADEKTNAPADEKPKWSQGCHEIRGSNVAISLSFNALLKCHNRLQNATNTERWLIRQWRNVSSKFVVAKYWIEIRTDHGFGVWLSGVVLAGALIGLGGPFWFDIYKRLSTLAQITRSFGFVPSSKPGKDNGTNKPGSNPKREHQPSSIYDAFETAKEAKDQVTRHKNEQRAFCIRAEAGERPNASQMGSPPRRPLDLDGNAIS